MEATLTLSNASPQLCGWNDDRARKVIRSLIRKIYHLFDGIPSIDSDDLESVAMDACREAWHKYDPWRGLNPSTFIWKIGKNHLISLYRPAWKDKKRSRKWWKEHEKLRTDSDIPILQDAAPIGVENDLLFDLDTLCNSDQPVDQWLSAIMLAARQTFPERKRPGQRSFAHDQLIGLAVLRARFNKQSHNEFLMMLDCRADLRSILRIRHLPGRTTIRRLKAMLKSEVGTAFLRPEKKEVGPAFSRLKTREVGTLSMNCAATNAA